MDALMGVFPALVTPLDAGGTLDRRGLDRLLDRVLAANVAGIAPAGSTGEGPLLSQAMRVDLTQAVREHVNAEQWVIPGVPAATAAAALVEIELLGEAGANAVLVPPPWYYPLSQMEIVDYFAALADASTLPILLYNIPRLTKVSIEPGTAAELVAHPMIVGMKDSSGDLDHVIRTADATRTPVLVGTDALFNAALCSGAAGTIGASGNLVPHDMCALFEAHLAGRLDEAERLQERVASIARACNGAGYPVGWKAALQVLGVCECHPALPLRCPDQETLSTLAAALRNVGY